MNKNILITGYSGFIGKYLTGFLKNKGYNVIPLKQDIKNPVNVDDKIDVVIHLAYLITNKTSNNINNVNVGGITNLLNFCKENKSKLIFTSTIQVYGNQKILPIKENTEHNPYNRYSESKIIGENLCRKYSQLYNLKFIILRLSNVYGNGMKKGYAIYDIVNNAKIDKPIFLNQPDVKRDFIYINDVLQAFLKSIEYDKKIFDIFNICLGKSYSLNEVVDITSKLLNKKLDVIYTRSWKEDVLNIYGDISYSKSELNWEPSIDLSEGIKCMLT